MGLDPVTGILIAGGLGAGASLYGASKAASAQDRATQANIEATAEANRLNYKRWLESQGVGENGAPINTWLPRYATVGSNFLSPTKKFRRAGSGTTTTVTPNSYPTGAVGTGGAMISSFGGGAGPYAGSRNYMPAYLSEAAGVGNGFQYPDPTKPLPGDGIT